MSNKEWIVISQKQYEKFVAMGHEDDVDVQYVVDKALVDMFVGLLDNIPDKHAAKKKKKNGYAQYGRSITIARPSVWNSGLNNMKDNTKIKRVALALAFLLANHTTPMERKDLLAALRDRDALQDLSANTLTTQVTILLNKGMLIAK